MKAILVLDEMPNKCEDCPFAATLRLSNTPISMCYVIKRPEVSADLEEGRPHWCPLKEMPSKIAVEDIDEHTDPLLVKMGYVNGWNDCLKEIEK